ncbi:MAG TPA: abortive infection family protein [Dermatophilaceae bacterium]
MELFEVGAVLGDFFADGGGPSHDELSSAFEHNGLSAGDPARSAIKPVGKMKRVRAVFVYASDNDSEAGLNLASEIVAGLRADGLFHPGDPQLIERAQRAFEDLGWNLAPNGRLSPVAVAGLSGTALTAALRAYVDRLNSSPDDAALLVGTSKDLDEAAARHVLMTLFGDYPKGANFPHTFTQAFVALGLDVPTGDAVKAFEGDPRKQLQHAVYLLALATNRLRNAQGTGHGRPLLQDVSLAEARLAARSTALTIGMLLDHLEGGGNS